MRLSAAILIIFLVFGAIWFAFFYYFDSPHPNPDYGTRISDRLSIDQAAFLLPVAETNYLPVRDFNVTDPEINAKAMILYDVRSGRILYAKNAYQRLPIASITKLMTAVVVLENLSLNEVFTVAAENVNVDGTGPDLQVGEKILGRDLMKVMLIKSSNDAALTFAVESQKKGINFNEVMNKKAHELAMNNTQFSDPSGLDDQNTFSTAADLIKLISYASRYNEIAEILTTPVTDVYSTDRRIGHHLINTNRLLGQLVGLVLGKTGYTDTALGTMAVMTAINDGRDNLISVVLGANDRSGETVKLIEWARVAYRWE